MDVKFFNSYIGAALTVFTRSHLSHASENSDISLCPHHGAAIRDFRIGAELGFSGIINYIVFECIHNAVAQVYVEEDDIAGNPSELQ